MLSPDTDTPEVTQTPVSTNLLQPLEVITQLRVEAVRQYLRVFAINNILLPVQEPARDFKLERVLDDGDDAFEFVRVEITSTAEPTS